MYHLSPFLIQSRFIVGRQMKQRLITTVEKLQSNLWFPSIEMDPKYLATCLSNVQSCISKRIPPVSCICMPGHDMLVQGQNVTGGGKAKPTHCDQAVSNPMFNDCHVQSGVKQFLQSVCLTFGHLSVNHADYLEQCTIPCWMSAMNINI